MTTDFPDGDGLPDCPQCRGRGVTEGINQFKMEVAIICPCTRERDLQIAIESAWRGLTRVTPVKKSVLQGHEGKNVWITAQMEDLQAHLHRIGRQNSHLWRFRVISDVDLMDAWLSNKSQIHDKDIVERRQVVPTDKYTTLTDLIEPPDLLVLRLGLKAARNVAAPEVLLEALNHRAHLGKPTWLVDTPADPLCEGHISWDIRVGECVSRWPKTTLGRVGTPIPPVTGLLQMGLGTAPVPLNPSEPPLVVPSPPSRGGKKPKETPLEKMTREGKLLTDPYPKRRKGKFPPDNGGDW